MLTRLVNTSNTSKYVLSLQTHRQQRFQNSMVTEAFSYLTFDSTENTSLVAQTVTNLPAMEETWFQPLGQEYLLEKGWLPTLVFLPGESHGQRSLGGSVGSQRVDMTEQLAHLVARFLNTSNMSKYVLSLQRDPQHSVSKIP